MKKKTCKISNTITKDNLANESVIDDYYCKFGLVKSPLNAAAIDALCDRMIDFGKNGPGISMQSFLVKEQIHITELWRLRQRYPKIESTYKETMLFIGERRIALLTSKELKDSTYLLRTQRHYDIDYDQQHQERIDEDRAQKNIDIENKKALDRLSYEQHRTERIAQQEHQMRLEDKKHLHDIELLKLKTEAQLKLQEKASEETKKMIPFFDKFSFIKIEERDKT